MGVKMTRPSVQVFKMNVKGKADLKSLLTAVLALRAVDECLRFALLVGLLTLLAYATYSIGNDLRLQGQSNAIKPWQPKGPTFPIRLCGHGPHTPTHSIQLNFMASAQAKSSNRKHSDLNGAPRVKCSGTEFEQWN